MKYVKKTLKNGMRAIAVPMPDALTVTVMIMVEAGSKYEDKTISGLSHFLEHMCFKGTTKRPRSIDISKELDAIGADYNAFTSQEYTAYYVKSHPKHLHKILEVAADLYMNPALDEKEIEKEKGVVIEEINMYEDTPMDQIGEVFQSVLYGDQPAGWPIIGTKETVQLLKREQLAEYIRRHYVASATTIVVVGNFDQKRIFSDIGRIFLPMNAGAKSGKKKVKDQQAAPSLYFKKKDSEQTHIGLGVRAFPAQDPRSSVLRVLNAVLGGGMSSRLWQRIREEMGVAYYVYPYFKPYTDHGYFAVFAGVDSSRVPEVIDAVMSELRRLKSDQIPLDELKKAKDYLLGQLYLGLESSDELAVFYGRQEILRQEIMKPADLAKAIKAVTAEDVRKVARQIFATKKLNLALIGRAADEQLLKSMLVF